MKIIYQGVLSSKGNNTHNNDLSAPSCLGNGNFLYKSQRGKSVLMKISQVFLSSKVKNNWPVSYFKSVPASVCNNL